MYRGIATFTLDYGTCPRWLFERMVRLGREMTRVIVAEYGADEFVRRIADPVWFQSLGTVLAFDWNASGLTTILTAALKCAIRGEEQDLGIFIAGGKGKTSRKTPEEITQGGERLNLADATTSTLVYNSRMSAKVDSALVQDGFQLYHHAFFFSRSGAWTVVQQGMNQEERTARRYHWHSSCAEHEEDCVGPHPDTHAETFSSRDAEIEKNRINFVREPHIAIVSDAKNTTLNLVARKSEETRLVSTELVQSGYLPIMKDITLLRKHASTLSTMAAFRYGEKEQLTLLNLAPVEFTHHPVVGEDFRKSRYLEKILAKVCDEKPKRYETLLAIEGVGGKTMRALALVAEVVYGADISYEDPARYSFAHGGKDATPYPVDRETYDATIETMKHIIAKTRFGFSEKRNAIQHLEETAQVP